MRSGYNQSTNQSLMTPIDEHKPSYAPSPAPFNIDETSPLVQNSSLERETADVTSKFLPSSFEMPRDGQNANQIQDQLNERQFIQQNQPFRPEVSGDENGQTEFDSRVVYHRPDENSNGNLFLILLA